MHRVSRPVYELRNKRAKPQAGDLIYAREAPAGNVALITEGQEVCLGQRTVLLRPNPKIADSAYLTYYLLAPEQKHRLLGTATGATVTHVNIPVIRALEISLPPLPVQRRIADILSAYDDLIENNRRRIALLEETARLTYRKWFGETASSCLSSPLSPRTATLADVCHDVRRGVSPDAIAPSTPYIGLEHMPRRSISLCEWDSAQKVTSTKLAFDAGDILFGKIRPYFHKVGIAFVSGVASSDAIVIKPNRPELLAYVLMTVSSDAFVAAASQGMKEGSKMPRADWKQMLQYPVALPDAATLAAFNKVLGPILAQLKTLCFSTRNLAASRDMLLPRLMKK
jgi:type I restriction enzyme S subunit